MQQCNVSSPKIAIMTVCSIYKITLNFKSKIQNHTCKGASLHGPFPFGSRLERKIKAEIDVCWCSGIMDDLL